MYEKKLKNKAINIIALLQKKIDCLIQFNFYTILLEHYLLHKKLKIKINSQSFKPLYEETQND